MTIVGGDDYDGTGADATQGIDVVKQGPGSLNLAEATGIPVNGTLPWGYNSAAHVCGNRMWFAVPITASTREVPTAIAGTTPDYWYASWISVTEL